MKKFKKVIPALCMLLVSAIMLGSTTYAWFSMNNKVTASGMTVTATTNTKFLVISATNTLATATTATVTEKSGGIGGNSSNVYPCAPVTQEGKPVAGLVVGDWYTANSKVFDNSSGVTGDGAANSNMTNIKKIGTSSDSLTNYQITYTFYIGLATGSTEAYTGKLTFTPTGYDITNNATRAIVKIGEQEHRFDAATAWQTTNDVTLSVGTATKVTVTLYIDGNHNTVKSNASAAITGTLGFTVNADGITDSTTPNVGT